MTKRSELNFPAIYTITHIASGKTYVGQTINVRIRWQLHRSALRRGKHRNCYLQHAWNKHGADTFEFAIYRDLRDVPSDQLAEALNKAEIELLATIKSPYNLMEAGMSGTVAGEETKALLRAHRKILWADPNHREKQRNSILELYAAPEWKAARDAAVKEGKNTPESKASVSAHAISLWADPQHRATQSAKRKANWQDPAYREQQLASRRASAANPEVRRRRSEGLKAAHARRKAAKLAEAAD